MSRDRRPPEDFEPVELEDFTAIGETDKALQVDPGFLPPQWIPEKSIHDDSEVYQNGDSGKLIIWRWMAVKKGWV